MKPANFLPFVVLAVLQLSIAGAVSPRQEPIEPVEPAEPFEPGESGGELPECELKDFVRKY